MAKKEYLNPEETKDIEFDFPLCTKSINGRVFSRYGEDGRFEQITFEKTNESFGGTDIPNTSIKFKSGKITPDYNIDNDVNINSLTIGKKYNNYHKHDRSYLVRITQLNTLITEDEFMEAVNKLMRLYKEFLNSTLTSEKTENLNNGEEEEMPF